MPVVAHPMSPWCAFGELCNPVAKKMEMEETTNKQRCIKRHRYSTSKKERWREREGENGSCLKIAALSFSASTLKFTVFLSLYATATLHWRDQGTRSLHGYWYCPLFLFYVKQPGWRGCQLTHLTIICTWNTPWTHPIAADNDSNCGGGGIRIKKKDDYLYIKNALLTWMH